MKDCVKAVTEILSPCKWIPKDWEKYVHFSNIINVKNVYFQTEGGKQINLNWKLFRYKKVETDVHQWILSTCKVQYSIV